MPLDLIPAETGAAGVLAGERAPGMPHSPMSTVVPLLSVSLPDTLHCANISIISDAECSSDYPGRLENTMVCAGVQGGGTDSCEVRPEGPWMDGRG